MYKGITKLKYTDPQLKKEAVKKAMEMLEKSRKALESALFDYMCNEDTYDDMGWQINYSISGKIIYSVRSM